MSGIRSTCAVGCVDRVSEFSVAVTNGHEIVQNITLANRQ